MHHGRIMLRLTSHLAIFPKAIKCVKKPVFECISRFSINNLSSLQLPFGANPNLFRVVEHLARHFIVYSKMEENISVALNNQSSSKLSSDEAHRDHSSAEGDANPTIVTLVNSPKGMTEFTPDSVSVKVDIESGETSEVSVTIDKSFIQVQKLSKTRLRKIERNARLKEKKRKAKMEKLHDINASSTDAGFSTENFGTTSYYFENGLRKVYPYYYTFSCFVKQRWIGRSLIDVFSDEFRSETPDQYRMMIQNGSVTVNGKQVSEDYILQTPDHIENRIHRHENPVSSQSIDILYEDDDMVVIDKPSSIPCHPCGRYHFNSIVFILGKEYNLPHLRNIYRLDRLTSGVLICGKTPLRTYQLEQNVVKREVEKEYICRVIGEFPHGITEVDQPLGCITQKLALFKVDPHGKASKTTFERLSFNGKDSVVKCHPHTGRTHQIRVHLQYLGHPIVNDPLYNTDAWGPHRGKGGQFEKTEEELIDAIMKTNNIGMWKEGDNPMYAEKIAAMAGANQTAASEASPPSRNSLVPEESSSLSIDKAQIKNNLGKDVLSETDVSCLGMVGANEPSAKKARLCSQGESGSWTGLSVADSSIESAQYENRSDEDVSCKPAVTDGMGIRSSSERDRPSKILPKIALDTQCNQAVDRPGFEPDKWIPAVGCYACKTLYMDPRPKDLVMYLHALRYKGPGWEFCTEIPEWAKEDWSEDA